MYRCKVCGGELIEISKGKYQCSYCRAESVVETEQSASSPNTGHSPEVLLGLANDFLRLHDFIKARTYFNKVLAVDGKNGGAWWGLFLADYEADNEDTLLTKRGIALDNVSLINARAYAEQPLKRTIEDFIDIYIEIEANERQKSGATPSVKINDSSLTVSTLADFKIVNAALEKYTGNANVVVIPEGVTSLKLNSFNKQPNIIKLVIPGTVNTINSYIGSFPALSELVIGNGVKEIKSSAFGNIVNLKRVVIPESVQSMGARIFNNLSDNLMDIYCVSASQPAKWHKKWARSETAWGKKEHNVIWGYKGE